MTRKSASPVHPDRDTSGAPPGDLAHVLQELHDHQAELRAQNDDLRRAQVELQHGRDRYYELYDLAPIAYVTLSAAGKILESNLSAARLLGVDRARLYNRSLASFMTPASADLFHRFLQAVGGALEKRGQELELVSADERRLQVHLDAIADVLPNGDGSAGPPAGAPSGGRVRCVLFDLSELRRAEAAKHVEELRTEDAEARLRASEARFRQIAETIEDVFFVEERGGWIAYATQAYERLSGRRREDLYSRPQTLHDHVHPEDRARVAAARGRVHKGEPFDEEYRLLRNDGEMRWVRERAYSVEDEQDGPTRIVGVVHDITAERELEEQLRQAQKMEAVGALASGIAHDFNNVLHTVLGFSNMALADDGVPPRAREHLQRVATAATRGADLTKQLMAFARKEHPSPKPVVIDSAVRAAAKLVERLVTEQVRVELALGAGLSAVRADTIQLEQILLNLAANARDAMPEGGTFRIGTDVVLRQDCARIYPGLRMAARYVRIIVSDDGAGMDEATRLRIFEPFFTTKAVGRGTGLGLSTVFAVVRQLGGQVDVRSAPGKGTTFTFLLPVCEEEGPTSSPRLPQDDLPAIRVRALLVEDDSLVRMTVRSYLDELGLDVVEADNVEQARSIFADSTPKVELLVTDVAMPQMTGPRLADALRSGDPTLRVLFISANPPEHLAGPAGDRASALLRKPFGKEALAQALEELLGRRPTPSTAGESGVAG